MPPRTRKAVKWNPSEHNAKCLGANKGLGKVCICHTAEPAPQSHSPLDISDLYCHPITGEMIIPNDKLAEWKRRYSLHDELVDVLRDIYEIIKNREKWEGTTEILKDLLSRAQEGMK